tara:strand:+ start:19 stop:1104 length:1086 start_codon:yes stop_codon:yes gene_type:complete
MGAIYFFGNWIKKNLQKFLGYARVSILLTGGLGYIGSHTAVALCKSGHQVVIYDDLSNSKVEVVKSIEKLTGIKIIFVKGSILDFDTFQTVLRDNNVDTVIHFAGLKAVADSVIYPIDYYEVNVGGAINVIKAMKEEQIKKFIFSSSATVYGTPIFLPINENHRKKAINPYGQTKLQIESILEDLARSDSSWRIACLRYFNPVGSHSSCLIGENPIDIPNNLMPRIVRVASGLEKELLVFGDDYPTADGTCERDYVHVEDLADGHLAALNNLGKQEQPLECFNLGTGQSCSVLELISAFENVTDLKVPKAISNRRSGDAATCYADVKKSREILNWEAKKSINEMCLSSWEYQNFIINKRLL